MNRNDYERTIFSEWNPLTQEYHLEQMRAKKRAELYELLKQRQAPHRGIGLDGYPLQTKKGGKDDIPGCADDMVRDDSLPGDLRMD